MLKFLGMRVPSRRMPLTIESRKNVIEFAIDINAVGEHDVVRRNV